MTTKPNKSVSGYCSTPATRMDLPLRSRLRTSISSPMTKSSSTKPICEMASMLAGSLTKLNPCGPRTIPASRNAAIDGIFRRAKMIAIMPASSSAALMSWTRVGTAPPAAIAGPAIMHNMTVTTPITRDRPEKSGNFKVLSPFPFLFTSCARST